MALPPTKTIWIFKGDKMTEAIGSKVPVGARVEFIRALYRRRALIRYKGEEIMTMRYCLRRVICCE